MQWFNLWWITIEWIECFLKSLNSIIIDYNYSKPIELKHEATAQLEIQNSIEFSIWWTAFSKVKRSKQLWTNMNARQKQKWKFWLFWWYDTFFMLIENKPSDKNADDDDTVDECVKLRGISIQLHTAAVQTMMDTQRSSWSLSQRVT